MRVRFISCITALAATILLASGAEAQGRGYIALRVPGYASTSPTAINDAGDVVGMAANCDGAVNVGFVYRRGRYSLIQPAGATFVNITALNDRDVVVGYFVDANQVITSFRYSRGQYELIRVPGYDLIPMAINNRGDITGVVPGSLGYQAFVLSSKGEFALLPQGHFSSVQVFGINSAGTISGTATTFIGENTELSVSPFVYRDGEFTFLRHFAAVFALNDRGDLLVLPEGAGRSAVYRNGALLPIEYPVGGLVNLSNNRVVGFTPTEHGGCSGYEGFVLRLP